MTELASKHLNINQFTDSKAFVDYSSLELMSIDSDCWNIGADVKASFGIACDSDNIYLRFQVEEYNIKAIYKKFNDPVYKDSCVEFFVSFEDGYYYNLEFNCIGTVLGAYGKGRENRVPLDVKLLGSIQTIPSLGKGKIRVEDRKTLWTLDIRIPKAVFNFSNLESFNNIRAYGNFYKCGDEQANPHYYSWSPITTENPDFHRPEYFAELKFA